MLNHEKLEELKTQILAQVDANFPEDQKELTKQQIQSMTDDEFENFLKQNNIIKDGEDPQTSQCIFCSIVKGETQSYKIDENNDTIAILELNPISKAHTLIIPKEHVGPEQIPESALTLAKQVSQKIKKELKPKDIQIYTSNLFGHEIINVLPIYENENQNSPRKQATPEELQNIQE
ncbi:HIT domain-containing protein, partial [bacterium]|nr:HIT domain-containing protein [bacterium]